MAFGGNVCNNLNFGDDGEQGSALKKGKINELLFKPGTGSG
jgi:hypothetical protein